MSNSGREFLRSLHPVLPDSMRVKQSDRFTVQKIPCCTLLKDLDDEQHVLKLNQSGFLIWQLCHEERSVGEIVDLLADAFEQQRDDMARDVSRVVDHLVEESALVQTAADRGSE